MKTTVVGSYPVVLKKEKSFIDKIKSIFGLYDEYHYAIERAVLDQIKAGIDVISDGQVRGDMVEIFTKGMYGFDGKKVIGKIEFIKPITLKDILYAKKIAKSQNPKVEVKGIITGPCTIASSVRVENFYSDNRDENLVYDIAKALRKEVEALKDHVPIIQIDEPILSTGLYDFEIARRAVEMIVEGIDVEFAMHVCGNVYNIIEELNKFPVSILDHEFASNKKNLDILENIEKKVGFGCVNTKIKKVESVDEIKGLIEEGLEILKNNSHLNKNLGESIYIDPDCGMRLLPIDVAFGKLKNMVEASKEVKIN
ncbi:MAG: methionine synthase [Methanococci archaeon]|nr:methionine synthase [Methanococci archaeon]